MRFEIRMYTTSGLFEHWIGTDITINTGSIQFKDVDTGCNVTVLSQLPIVVIQLLDGTLSES